MRLVIFILIIIFASLDFVIINLFHEHLNFVYNPGIAFGIFRNIPGFSLLIQIVSSLILLCVTYFTRDKLIKLFLALMSAGAIANLLSRIINGHVIDYIPMMMFDINFNIADLEIFCGAFIIFLIHLFNNTLDQKTAGTK